MIWYLMDNKRWMARSGMTPKEQLDKIYEAVAPLYKERDKTYAEIKKQLHPYGVCGLDFQRTGSSGEKVRQTLFQRTGFAAALSADRLDSQPCVSTSSKTKDCM